MVSENKTDADLLAEVADFLAKQMGGRPSADWFTYRELYAKTLEQMLDPADLPDAKFRYRLDKMVAERKFEKYIVNNKDVYYRKV